MFYFKTILAGSSMINKELTNARNPRIVKITMGLGKAISATKGAKITKNRQKKFVNPSDVAQNRVGKN